MLHLYDSPESSTPLTGLSSSHDITAGSWETHKLWVRNNDANLWYDNVTVRLNPEKNLSESGCFYMLFAGDVEPTVEEWGLLEVNSSIKLSNLGSEGSGDTTTYLPFFLRVYVPASTTLEPLTEVQLRISAISNPV